MIVENLYRDLFWDLLGISWGSLGDLLGISWGSLGDLLGISWGSLWDLVGVYLEDGIMGSPMYNFFLTE